MTVSITLESSTEPATYEFPLDGEAPQSGLALPCELSWRATVSDISGIPARVAYAKLSSGVRIVDVPVVVSISVGTACEKGKAMFQDGARWGHFYLRDDEDLIVLGLYVSGDLFKRLTSLCERGFQPAITAELRETETLTESSVDGRLETWHDDQSRDLIVDWCHFRATFPHFSKLWP